MRRFGVFEYWLARLNGMIVNTVRAASPNLEEGTYEFGFVPMGDSPSKIRIDIKGKWSERDMDQFENVFSLRICFERNAGRYWESQNTTHGSMLDRNMFRHSMK